MSFTPNIPTSGQTLGNSRPQVLNNFASLRTTISNLTQPNHIDVNNVGAGKHIFVQMPVQTPGAANLPLANEGGLITQTKAGNSELFYVRDNVNTYLQMTGGVFVAASGYAYAGAGLLIQWAQINVANNATVTFPIAFSAAPFSITANEISNGTAVFDIVKPNTATATTTTFVLSLVRVDGNPQTVARAINYIAIGPA